MKRASLHETPQKLSWQIKLSNYLTALVVVLVPFHAFLTVWGSTFVGHFLWLRLWDEVILLILCVLLGAMLWRDTSLLHSLIRNRLAQLIGAYGAVTIIWGIVAYMLHQVTPLALVYGLVVDLRFLVWFVAVWVVVQRSPWLANYWKGLVFWPLAAVVAFGLLQFFVWPSDILKEFGYGPNTYVPYITLNQDSTIVRIQSTLRGANAFGAYLAVGITLLASLVALKRRLWKQWLFVLAAALALVLTFSRSGWIAVLVGAAVVFGVKFGHKAHRTVIFTTIGVFFVLGFAGALVVRTNSDAQDLVYHVSDHTTAKQTSNEQHAGAFTAAVANIIREPLGRGPGTSGQASWYNTGHRARNPESLLLQIGEETGWLGLGLFVAILIQLGRELWARRNHNLALAMLASLIGITLISFVTYSWVDDTLAFIWWALAALACVLPGKHREFGAH
jgi:hypothetical protein